MPRPSTEVRAELDELNRKRRAIDKIIEDNRKRLYELNAKVPDLEREFQEAVALEQQAALAASGETKH